MPQCGLGLASLPIARAVLFTFIGLVWTAIVTVCHPILHRVNPATLPHALDTSSTF